MKIAIIGAGSSYTPEIVEGLANHKETLPVEEIVLVDIDEKRLAIMAAFCQRFLHHLGHPINIRAATDRRAAVAEAQFVIVQIRVGGNAQRVQDEKIPLKYGILGQETTGPGGMLKAFRTIPVMLDMVRDMETHAPGALHLNYVNPMAMITTSVESVSSL